MWREFGIINSTVQEICKNRTKIISVSEQNGWRIKGWRKPEPSDVDEAVLTWLQQERSDNVPMSGPFLMTIFVLHKF